MDLQLPTKTVIATIPTIDFDYYREIIVDGQPSSSSRLVTRNQKLTQNESSTKKGESDTITHISLHEKPLHICFIH